jgi:VWFA-related protein
MKRVQESMHNGCTSPTLSMKLFRGLLYSAILMAVSPVHSQTTSEPQRSSDVATIRTSSSLVFLDVTVLDQKGHTVSTGLTRDDFLITEDKKPETIFSFEGPELHVNRSEVRDESENGQPPITIFVADLLNSSFEDFGFIRYSIRKYLAEQGAQLTSPAELLVLGNKSLELLQGFTPSRDDLLYALDHLGPVIPYKWQSQTFDGERFQQSVVALQEIALQNKGVTGRKNIVWVGYGSPNFSRHNQPEALVRKVQRYLRETTNMLVDARMSLFVIYPGLHIGHFVNLSGPPPIPISARDAEAPPSDDDNPFSDHFNFGEFVNETGGKLFYNHNDVAAEMEQSERLGSEYYTLTYQPKYGDDNGKFRRVRVTLRDQNLRAITKTGYFAPEQGGPVDPHQRIISNLADAAISTVPFTALNLKVSDIVQHPDNQTADFTVQLKGRDLYWKPSKSGSITTDVILKAVSLTADGKIVASKVQDLTLFGPTQNAANLAEIVTPIPVTIRVPKDTKSVRVVVESEDNGRIGAADLDASAIAAAPATPTPVPTLKRRPRN